MVMTRSMTARRTPPALPHDMVVEIAGRVAATSPHPMEDICSLRATCQAMRRACKEGAVGSRVALEREESMRWFEHDRYLALVNNLAGAGNPEACFVLGLTLVFAHHQQQRRRRTTLAADDTEPLRRAAAAGHKAAAYVLGVLHYVSGDKEEAERYITQVEGEGKGQAASDDNGVRTNRECVKCRALAVQAVGEVTWKVGGMTGPVQVPLPPPPEEGGQGQGCCKGNGCGVPEGWTADCAVFCSDGCRIRHEYSEFFSRVPSGTLVP